MVYVSVAHKAGNKSAKLLTKVLKQLMISSEKVFDQLNWFLIRKAVIHLMGSHVR